MNKLNYADVTDEEKKALIDPARKVEQPFSILGYNAGNFYLYSPELSSVIILKETQFKGRYLNLLAPVEYWLKFFPASDKRKTSGVNWKNVKVTLINHAIRVGVFEGTKYMKQDKSLKLKRTP